LPWGSNFFTESKTSDVSNPLVSKADADPCHCTRPSALTLSVFQYFDEYRGKAHKVEIENISGFSSKNKKKTNFLKIGKRLIQNLSPPSTDSFLPP